MRSLFAASALALVLSCVTVLASSLIDPEDQKLIEAAGCEEIVMEHKNFLAAEQELAAEIRQNDNGEVAGNIAGAAMLATLGIGFFSWDDQTDAKGNLAELTAYREAIAAEGKKKNCTL